MGLDWMARLRRRCPRTWVAVRGPTIHLPPATHMPDCPHQYCGCAWIFNMVCDRPRRATQQIAMSAPRQRSRYRADVGQLRAAETSAMGSLVARTPGPASPATCRCHSDPYVTAHGPIATHGPTKTSLHWDNGPLIQTTTGGTMQMPFTTTLRIIVVTARNRTGPPEKRVLL